MGADKSAKALVLVTMSLELKRKLQLEAKRRGQTLSEYIRDRCDFDENVGEHHSNNRKNGGKR